MYHFFFLAAIPSLVAALASHITPRNATTFCPPFLASLAHTKLPKYTSPAQDCAFCCGDVTRAASCVQTEAKRASEKKVVMERCVGERKKEVCHVWHDCEVGDMSANRRVGLWNLLTVCG
jgi:hypothetical protein